MGGRTADILLSTLRFGPCAPDALAAGWSAIDYSGLAALVDQEMCPLWLYRRLHSEGLLGVVDDGFTRWLKAQARAISAHNTLVDEQADRARAILARSGVPHVFLKGAARRWLKAEIPYADARATSDVDVLVPQEGAAAAFAAFVECGFREAFDPELVPPEHFHMMPLVSELPVTVELHTSTSARVGPLEAWRRTSSTAAPVDTPTGPAPVPDGTELFWHGLTHALTHGPEWFWLRSLLDIACVWVGGLEVRWSVIEERLRSDEIADPHAASVWLGAAGWLAGEGRPGPLAHDEAGRLHRLMRWRLRTCRREGLPAALSEVLVTESSRAEFGLPLDPVERGWGIGTVVRRRSASILARGWYRGWRWARGRG